MHRYFKFYTMISTNFILDSFVVVVEKSMFARPKKTVHELVLASNGKLSAVGICITLEAFSFIFS